MLADIIAARDADGGDTNGSWTDKGEYIQLCLGDSVEVVGNGMVPAPLVPLYTSYWTIYRSDYTPLPLLLHPLAFT